MDRMSRAGGGDDDGVTIPIVDIDHDQMALVAHM